MNQRIAVDDGGQSRREAGKRRRSIRRRRCWVLLFLLLAAFHAPILRLAAWQLTADAAVGTHEVALVLSGDHRLQTAAELYSTERVKAVWLIKEPPDYLVTEGIVPSPAEVSVRELAALGIPHGQIEVLAGRTSRELADVVRLLKTRMETSPQTRVLAICGRLEGRHVRLVLDRVLEERLAAQVTVMGIPHDEIDLRNWWRSRKAIKLVFSNFCELGITAIAGIAPDPPRPLVDPDQLERELVRQFGEAACYEF
jgi:hypothetical protein